jgi:large subunit ribosomal protein L4
MATNQLLTPYGQEKQSTLLPMIGAATAACLMVLGVASMSAAPATTQLASMTVPRTVTQVHAPAAMSRSAMPLRAGLVNEPEFVAPAQEEMHMMQQPMYTQTAAPTGPAPLGWAMAAMASVGALFYAYTRYAANKAQEAYDAEIFAKLESRAWAMAAVVGEMKASIGPATVRVTDTSGAEAGTQELHLKSAGVTAKHIVHKKLVAELANRRQGNAHTKTRAEVRGGGKKPYNQKGTGNARRGSSRSPLMRGGGVTFGPRNTRNWKQTINRKEGQLAVSSLIQNRAGIITVVKGLDSAVTSVNTKAAATMIEGLKQPNSGKKVLVVVEDAEWDAKNPLYLSTRNIPHVRYMQQKQLAIADLLWPHQILVSDKAMEAMQGRFAASA